MTAPSEPATKPRPIRAVGIVAKNQVPEAAQVVANIAEWLAERGIDTMLDTAMAQLAEHGSATAVSKRDLPARADVILVLGGDGTLLGVAREVVRSNTDVPVLAVNFGSLGFLTEITLPELYGALESVIDGTADFDERQMLQAEVARDGEPTDARLALNDVVITRSALSNIIEFSVSVGTHFVTSVRADGLIIASPTGSTAHNMAAGGPIVHPAVDAILLTPIAPHTLTNRPIVIPSATPIHVTPHLEHDTRSVFVSFDGQSGFELVNGDVVTVMRAKHPLRVVRSDARDYFAVLREKLKWGQR